MYRVTKMYGKSTKGDVNAQTLVAAREIAKKWCSGRKPESDRAAIIFVFTAPRKVRILETYVEDTGGSGRAVRTRKYNSKTGRSTVL